MNAFVGMNIRQATEWALRGAAHGACSSPDTFEEVHAVYDVGSLQVQKTGSYEACRAFLKSQCGLNTPNNSARTTAGRYLTLVSLATVAQEMAGEEGEKNCLPEPGEVREWL